MIKGQRVKVPKPDGYVEGIISSMEEKRGFKGRMYFDVHVKVGDKLETYHEWDLIEIVDKKK